MSAKAEWNRSKVHDIRTQTRFWCCHCLKMKGNKTVWNETMYSDRISLGGVLVHCRMGSNFGIKMAEELLQTANNEEDSHLAMTDDWSSKENWNPTMDFGDSQQNNQYGR